MYSLWPLSYIYMIVNAYTNRRKYWICNSIHTTCRYIQEVHLLMHDLCNFDHIIVGVRHVGYNILETDDCMGFSSTIVSRVHRE